MKLFFLISFLILLNNCSFDNKSGIWKNENIELSKENNEQFNDFKKFSSTEKEFNEIIVFNEKFKFKKSPLFENYEWKDIFFADGNNLKNFIYLEKNELKFLGKKISRNKLDKYLIVENNNLITSDLKGNIIIFSINENLITHKFNFYKKKYKNINKKLNLIVKNNIIYISDNLGYFYAYDYYKKKVLWAKNYKIPFRSNIKIAKNYLITSNQDNNLIFLNIINGNLLKSIPTEESSIKNQFINNISLNKQSIFFLNSFGTLYSFDSQSLNLKWFINLKKTTETDAFNLFLGSQIVNNNDIVVISSNKSTYVIDSYNGSILDKKNFSNIIKPIIYNENIFFLTKNNYLICLNINTNKILYSYEINQLIADFYDITKKDVMIETFLILNNKIFIFLRNSYVLKLKLTGELIGIDKLPAKINSEPIIIDKSLLLIDKRNRLAVID